MPRIKAAKAGSKCPLCNIFLDALQSAMHVVTEVKFPTQYATLTMCIRNKNAAVEQQNFNLFLYLGVYHRTRQSTSYMIFLRHTTVRINFSESAQPKKKRLCCLNRNKLRVPKRRHLEMKNVLLREIISRECDGDLSSLVSFAMSRKKFT